MAVTGRLSRALYPRWLTTSKTIEFSPATEGSAEKDYLPVEFISPTPAQETETTTGVTTSNIVGRLKDVLRTSVANVSRKRLSSQTTTRQGRKADDSSHSILPGQSFADAMSECHSSVDQYYGLAHENFNTGNESFAEKSKNKANSKAAIVAAKRAKIMEAKQHRLSNVDLQRRVKSLTLNAMAPGISVVSRMTRLRELCDHVKHNPLSRLTAVNVSQLHSSCVHVWS